MRRIVTYGSVCSGIEAASFVLKPLGLRPLWFSEIAEFPTRFLSVRYPGVPNLGDMNGIPKAIHDHQIEVPDMLCGGTPCQAFSLAGWKNGLNDDRGQLTLKYLDILNEIDRIRLSRGQSRSVFFWENVEGVLKDKTNAFGFFLAGILGLDKPLEIGKWSNAGVVFGEERNVAWRILDAKYFGIPQQRKRLYVLGGGVDFNPLNVLFDFGEPFADPLQVKATRSEGSLSLFDEYSNGTDLRLFTPLTKTEADGTSFEVFRSYSDCVYAAYGTKWNGNAASFNGSLFVSQNGRVRRLTPRECERLMGFPDDYTDLPKCKITNRYQAIGNSWAVPVIKWIFSRLEHGFKSPEDAIEVQSSPLYVCSNSLRLCLLDGFVSMPDGCTLNANAYPSDYVISNMLDIIDRDADEKYYLSPAGCAGILRRKRERNVNINSRLQTLLEQTVYEGRAVI